MSGAANQVDVALALVELAADTWMSEVADDGGSGVLLARRCLEVQDLLIAAGASPGVLVDGADESPVGLLRRAEAALDAVIAADRAPAWGPARVELRALVVEAAGD